MLARRAAQIQFFPVANPRHQLDPQQICQTKCASARVVREGLDRRRVSFVNSIDLLCAATAFCCAPYPRNQPFRLTSGLIFGTSSRFQLPTSIFG